MSTAEQNRSRWPKSLTGFLFLTPFLVPFAAFWLWPIANGLYLSFTDANMLRAGEANGIGFENYSQLLSDRVYRQSMGNTLLFVVENVPVLVIGGLLLAVLLNEPLTARAGIRAVFVAPYLITGSAVAIIWQFVLDPSTGWLNSWLSSVGLPTQNVLSQPDQAMWAVTLITLWWRVGFPLLVILAALQDIPQDLYDAAKIDGAGAVQRFRTITLPLITPVLIFVLIIRLIDSFKVFAQVYLVTGGGPFGSTRVAIQYLYETGFLDFRTGYAAAIGWSVFLIILVVTAVQLLILRRVRIYE